MPAKKRWAYAYLPLVHPTGQGMGETMPAQNLARITTTMTDVNNASFNSLVICAPSFVRLASGCRLTLLNFYLRPCRIASPKWVIFF